MGREISGTGCCIPRSGNVGWFPGCRPAPPPPPCWPAGGCEGGACWPPCCWLNESEQRKSVMAAIATARTHIIMRLLQVPSFSALRQPEISPLAVVTPSPSHCVPLDGTFNNVVYSLAVVTLGVK